MINAHPRQALGSTLAAGAILVLAAAFAGPALAQVNVGITFDAAGCPVRGSVPTVIASRGQNVTWQAQNGVGEPTTEAFKIYFDPLQGATLRAGRGTVSRPIDPGAPRVCAK